MMPSEGELWEFCHPSTGTRYVGRVVSTDAEAHLLVGRETVPFRSLPTSGLKLLCSSDGSYFDSHQPLREVVYEGMPPPTRNSSALNTFIRVFLYRNYNPDSDCSRAVYKVGPFRLEPGDHFVTIGDTRDVMWEHRLSVEECLTNDNYLFHNVLALLHKAARTSPIA